MTNTNIAAARKTPDRRLFSVSLAEPTAALFDQVRWSAIEASGLKAGDTVS
jgi:hypothetical protein